MKRILILIILALIVASGFGFVWLRFTAPKPGELDTLQNGDLVLQTIKSPQTLAIIFATRSPYTHIGIIKQDPKNGPMVVEAADAVQETPLTQWLKQGLGERVTVKRLRDMTPQLAARILNAAGTHYGKPYDFLFRLDRNALYCSELVYYAFQDGGKIKIGRAQTLIELHFDNFAVQRLLEQRWRDHPQCQTPPSNNFAACTDMIMKQDIITPASIAADSRLETVYDNYGLMGW